MSLGDTIVARATPAGQGGIAVVRLSGARAVEIGKRIFKARPGWEKRVRYVTLGRIMARGREIDSGLAWIMRAPHSFTGEDTVEISSHGSMAVVEQIIEEAVRHGARLAERGEFTRRAFLNGRLDLLQAEAVIDLIRARGRDTLGTAFRAMSGRLSRKVEHLRSVAQEARVHMEMSLEFEVEQPSQNAGAEWGTRLRRAAEQAERLAETFESARRRDEGWLVALVGRPNVGKSTLLNALLGEERAIVTPEAGTTRDMVEGRVWWEGEEVRLVDTAGVRKADGASEQAGVARALRVAREAHVVIVVVNGAERWTQADTELVERVAGRPAVVALSKSDLKRIAVVPHEVGKPVVPVCALTGAGLDELVAWVRSVFPREDGEEELTITRRRHALCLERMGAALRRAAEGLEAGVPEECCAVDLGAAVGAADELLGESVGADVLDVIFEEFCVGK